MESAANHSSCTGYYCHNCNATISPVRNYLCPDCNLGFIEKLHDSPAATSPFTDRNSENREDLDSASVFDGVFPGGNGMGGNIEVIFRREADRANTNDSRPSSSRREAASHSNAPSERRRPRTQNYPVTIEHMLSEFLTNMSRTNAQNMDSNAPVFLVSNPGDYAWGREGLDTIVTQLLNQMDSSGPPPLDKDKIKELPFVRITEQQVSENIQCSVCWDTFRMAESVRQLPCEHIYHDLCITPWLELHGTCPICRKLLSDDGDSRLGGFPHGGGFEALLSDVHRLTILQNGFTTGSSRGTRARRRNGQCYRCNEFGHYARECPTRNQWDGRQGAGHGRTRYDRMAPGWVTPSVVPEVPSSAGHTPPPPSFFDLYDVTVDYEETSSFDWEAYEDADYYLRYEVYDDSPSVLSDAGTENLLSCELPFDGWENNTDSYTGGSSSSATYYGGGPPAGRGRNSGSQTTAGHDRKRKMPFRCYSCDQPGHLARDCPRSQMRCGHCSKRGHETSNCWYAPDRQAGRNASTGSRTYTSRTRARDRGDNPNLHFSLGRGRGGSGGGGGPSTSRSATRRGQGGSGVTSSSWTATGRGQGGRQHIQCWKCGNFGHLARECVTGCDRCGSSTHSVEFCFES